MTNEAQSIHLPNVELSPAGQEENCISSKWHKMLVALRGASDKAGNSALRILTEAHIAVNTEKENRKSYRTVESAYNSPGLAGGGFNQIKEKVYKVLAYCINPTVKHGKLNCQRLLPDGHTGPCPWCSWPTEADINGRKSYLSVDHVIELGAYYQIVMKSTDLAQLICNYYPTSIKRLSTPLSDRSARVYCTESGLIARR